MISDLYLNSNRPTPPLRIGIMVDGDLLIRPFLDVLRHIRDSNFARIALVIRHAPATTVQAAPRRGSFPVRLLRVLSDGKGRPHLLHRAYSRWDEGRQNAAGALLSEEDSRPLLADIPELLVTPISKGFTHRFPGDALEAIQQANLDVILRFGFNILRGEILTAARYGIWSYHHGDNDYYRGGPSMFWEIAEQNPLSGTILQVLSEKLDDGLVLCKLQAATALGISRANNATGPYVSASWLVIWKLHQLHEQGWDVVQQQALTPAPYRGRVPIYRTPDNLQMARFAGQQTLRRVGRMIRADRRERHWQVAVRKASPNPWESSWDGFHWIDSPRGHFYADPFLIEYQGKTWLFVEDYDYFKKVGVIACAEVLPNGSTGPWRLALERPYHLSFPFLFEHDGQVFMIPETERNGTIELYRATSFPWSWELDCTLLEKPGLDTTLHIDPSGHCYFFTSLLQRPEAQPQLFLFHSSGLREPWRLHPASPLSLDIRYSRNGGALLPTADGGWIRPSQDGSRWYGRQMHFHKIERLNTKEYRESLLGTRSVERVPDLVGTHSYTAAGAWEAVDVLRLVPGSQIR